MPMVQRSSAVFKNEFDEKHQLKVVVVNTFVTFASSQLFVSDVQQIYDAISGLDVNKELSSFLWSPDDLLCLVLFAFKKIMVLLLLCEAYVLLVNNVKAKVFKEYSAVQAFPATACCTVVSRLRPRNTR